MNGVIGMNDLLLGTELTPRQRRYASLVRGSADSLLTLINAILDFSKIEAGKLELVEIEFDLAIAVEEVIDMFSERAEKKGLLLACHVDPALRQMAKGDPDRLRQVLINLITNAIKFTERGEIVVRVTVDDENLDGNMVRFAVTDSGIGIPPDRLDRLFKSFSQVDASTTRKYGGTGLGLAISKQLAELMGGRIGVESMPGQGSTFWFTAKLGRPLKATPRLISKIDPRGARVLVVDENSVHREIVRSQLLSWDLRATSASHGAEALHLVDQATRTGDPFAVVVLDSAIQDLEPAGLAQSIREIAPKTKSVLMLPGIGGAGVEPAEIAERGFDGHIARPVRQSQLLDTIMDAIASGKVPPMPKSPSTANVIATGTAAARGARILLVEDNEVNQMVASELLAGAGYICQCVDDGKKAVETVLQTYFDLVLMDCQMPEMDGFDATRMIRKAEAERGLPGRSARLPIIALTANALKGDREHCVDAGMDDYLSKPLKPEILVKTIQSHLELRHQPGKSSEAAASSTAGGKRPTGTTVVAERNPPLDMEKLLHVCGGQHVFAGRVLEKFRVQSLVTLEALRNGMNDKNSELTTRSAHTLKGMAGTIAAESLRMAAGEAEAQSHAGDWDALERQLEQIRRELDSCLAFIPNVVAKMSEVTAVVANP